MGPFENCLMAMERRGLLVDPAYFSATAKEATLKANEIINELAEWTIQDFGRVYNWRSPQQVAQLLYHTMGLPLSPVCGKGKPKKDSESTDNKALAWCRDYCKKGGRPTWSKAINLILELKKCFSAVKYLEKFPLHADSEGYIHCTMQPDTETMRLAARTPELQQVPVRKEKDPYHIRKGFIAPFGYDYIVADQSQLEMRILAHLLHKMFNDDSLTNDILDVDCHGKNAIRIYGSVYPQREVLLSKTKDDWEAGLGQMVLLRDFPAERVKGYYDPFISGLRETIKNIAYGLIYGMTEFSLGAHLKDEKGEPIGDAMAKVLADRYKDLYPSLRQYTAWAHTFAVRHGGMVDLVGGFRPIPEAKSSNKWIRQAGLRKAENTPMQRGAANIMALASIRIEDNQRLNELGFTQRLQIHDELDGYCPEEASDEVMEIIKYEMENAMELMCPLEVEPGKGKSWYDAK